MLFTSSMADGSGEVPSAFILTWAIAALAKREKNNKAAMMVFMAKALNEWVIKIREKVQKVQPDKGIVLGTEVPFYHFTFYH